MSDKKKKKTGKPAPDTRGLVEKLKDEVQPPRPSTDAGRVGQPPHAPPRSIVGESDSEPLIVQVDYEDDHSLIMESVGPNSALGIVADAIFGHYSESPSGKKLKGIRVGFSLKNEGVQVT